MDDDEFLMPYGELRDALGSSAGGTLAFTAGMGLWLALLFYVLYLVTERHFVRALARLAALLRLSPDIAGLTLLALGNGAPDFFTAVFGARTQFDMIFGAAVGSGLFIVTAVFGLVIWCARPAQNQLDGVIAASTADTYAPVPGACPQAAGPSTRCPRVGRRAFVRNAGVYLGALVLMGVLMAAGRVPLWLCLVLPLCYAVYMGYALAEYIVRRRAAADILGEASPVGSTSSVVDADASAAFCRLPLLERMRTAAAFPKGAGAWAALQRAWWVFSAIVSLPLALTILPLDYGSDTASKTPDATLWLHRLRCVAAPWVALPLAVLLFARQSVRSEWRAWMLLGCVSAALSALLLATTRSDDRPRGYALHVFVSFVACIAWVYVVCSELVAALVALGATWTVPAGVLGVLVLAWGNSFGDLVANVAVARSGNFETAVSAVLCGPIQNTLLTLGVASVLGALASPDHVLVVHVDKAVYAAYALLVATLVLASVSVVLAYDCRVPRRLGMILIAVYICYLVLSLLFLLRSYTP